MHVLCVSIYTENVINYIFIVKFSAPDRDSSVNILQSSFSYVFEFTAHLRLKY